MKYHCFTPKALASQITLATAGLLSVGSWAQAPAQPMVEEVVVVGLAASQERNLDAKRFANSVTDTVTAEEIGKLPDVTIADTLQRVPGVQIRRSAGEGSTINVRGMPQVTALLNGEQFLSAGSITTVQPDFTDVPSSLISGLEVHKSPTASLLAGGVSGTINMQTVRPFDLDEGLTLSGNAEMSRGSESKEDDGKLSAFAGFNHGDFGVVVTATFDQSNLANYRNGTILNGMEVIGEDERDQRDFNNDGDNNDSFLTQRFHGVMDKTTERERMGLSTSVQANLSDSLEFIGDVFYTEMDDYDRQQGMMIDTVRGNNWAYSDDFDARLEGPLGGSIYTTNRATLMVPRVSSYSESLTNGRESTNVNLQLNYDNGGRLRGSARYLHGDAERTHTENVAHGFITSGEQHGLLRNDGGGVEPVNPRGYGPDLVEVGFDRTGKYVDLAFEPGFGDDITRYNLVSTYSENNFTEEASLDVLRLDGSYDFDANHITSVDFGVRYGQRDVDRETYILVAPFTTGSLSADVMWKDSGASLGDTNGDGENSVAGGDLTLGSTQYYTDLPDGWVNERTNFGPSKLGGTFYFVNPEMLDDNVAFQNAIYPGNKALVDPATSYSVEEATQTAYVQVNFEGDIGSFPYSGNIGAQYIQTDLDIMQNLVGGGSPCSLCTVSNKIGEETIERSYDDFLPAANLAIELTDDVILRAAYAKTMTSLDIDDLAGGLSVGRSRAGSVLGAELGVNPDLMVAINGVQNGNPGLEPWRSDNFDLSAEWYFASNSMISLAAFYMDIESFIESGTVMMGLPDEDGVVRRELPVSTNINGSGGSIKGLEFAYQQAFDFLPGFWGGFGTSLNFTYAPSDSANVDVYGSSLPIQDNSERSGNAVLWYEQYGWQVRLAANYRSDRLDRLADPLGQGVIPIWTDATTYMDLSVSYDVTDEVSVYVQGSNITEEFEDQYAQWEDYVITQNIYESRWALGVRARF
ncbi:TonB-dependent receptor [Marinimicrobium sp. ARAG 43.8]|uniref:TonB-dependent receptor n=1 Tax=Marinimicrobium sp. ARAG 43.8 TaxID=3418719 RepID=UPI003CF94F0F